MRFKVDDIVTIKSRRSCRELECLFEKESTLEKLKNKDMYRITQVHYTKHVRSWAVIEHVKGIRGNWHPSIVIDTRDIRGVHN